MPYELTSRQRDQYRQTSIRSGLRKKELLAAAKHGRIDRELVPRLSAEALMPMAQPNGFSSLSLFSGGGGLDLGFERAGYSHVASVEILDICGATLEGNRPGWALRIGDSAGDVRGIPFSTFRGVDVVHGGPPCQPFSVAGYQRGEADVRNMWPDFVRCVLQCRPRAFVAENVPGILDRKFERFVAENVLAPLGSYSIFKFKLAANDFGVPQARRRVFFVGFRTKRDAARWEEPSGSYGGADSSLNNHVRWSLGLPDIGFDTVAPTLRSGFTGPRNTTGVVNSKASMAVWDALQIWPNGVQPSREQADAYPPENGHYRLSIADCALIQGFPQSWRFSGAVYQALGQIGNSVCPPVAYAVALNVAKALTAI